MSGEAKPAGWRGPELAFDTNDPEFCRGFEAGRLWAKLRDEPDIAMDFYLHDTNVEMVMRMAEVTKRETRAKDLNDNWLLVLFGPSGRSLDEVDPSTIRHY